MEVVKITRESGIPLLGHIAFGVIDRGSNLLQVRATSVCNLHCTFCSTAAGPELHPVNYEVELSYLLDWIKEVIKLKDCDDIEINIDSAGEPAAYPELVELVEALDKMPDVKFISMQTNGTLLTEELVKNLEKAGLGRINLSIHALDESLARQLMSYPYYDLEKIRSLATLVNNSKIELDLTPVFLPKVNDAELPKLIQLAKDLDCKISIQKYETYKFSRKNRKAKRITWFKFYRQLEQWEKEFGMKLKHGPLDFNIRKVKKVPLVLEKGKIVEAEVKAKGWMRGEVLAAAKGRALSIVECNASLGDKIKVKIFENRNSIYLAKKA